MAYNSNSSGSIFKIIVGKIILKIILESLENTALCLALNLYCRRRNCLRVVYQRVRFKVALILDTVSGQNRIFVKHSAITIYCLIQSYSWVQNRGSSVDSRKFILKCKFNSLSHLKLVSRFFMITTTIFR